MIKPDKSNLNYARNFLLSVKAAMFATVSFLFLVFMGSDKLLEKGNVSNEDTMYTLSFIRAQPLPFILVQGSHSSWAMKDPLLKRFLTDGWSGRVTENTIANGFLALDFELLDAIGHWVCTEKIMSVWSSHALGIATSGYKTFKKDLDRRHTFKPWDIEGLLLPKRLFKMGPFGTQDLFVCVEILDLLVETKYVMSFSPFEIERVRIERQNVLSKFGAYHVPLSGSLPKYHVPVYVPSEGFVRALSAFIRAFKPDHCISQSALTNSFPTHEITMHPLYLEIIFDIEEESGRP